MKTIVVVLRWMLGILFFLYGVSKFHAFMPTPPMAPEAARFVGALVETGYLWFLVGVVEILGAILLVSGRFATFGLMLLSPIVLNIVPYLLLLQSGVGPAPYMMAAFLLVSMSFLAWAQRQQWLPVLGK